MKSSWIVLATLLSLTLLAGCAAGPNPSVGTEDAGGDVAGFWLGLWHGFILLFTFIVSLFNDSVQVYDVHNTGNLYNLGYVLGAMLFFGGGGHGSRKKSR